MKQILKKKSPGNQQRFRLAIFLLLAAGLVGVLIVSRNRDALAKSVQQNTQRDRQARQQEQIQRAKPTGQPIVQADFGPDRPLLPASNIVSESASEPGESITAFMGRSKPQPPRDPGGSGGGDNKGGPFNSNPYSPPPPTVFDPITQTDFELGNDPQIAVGKRYIVATEAHHVVFYDKQTGLQSTQKSGGAGTPVPTRMSATALFAPVLAPFLNGPDGKPDPRKPNTHDINRHLGAQSASFLTCNPDNPIAAGCINEAYDTRVIYDRDRHCFWIESALRDQIWTPGKDCDKHMCQPRDTGLPRRFIAVAVSKTEDPRDGFHEFVLVDDYSDWPRIAVHGPFLVLSHNGNQNVYLFDADKLAKGNFNHGFVSLGSYSEADFGGKYIYPVVQHDRHDETGNNEPTIPTVSGGESKKVPTFLVGIDGRKITIFAFDPAVIDQPTDIPLLHPKLMRSSVELDQDVPWLSANPVYRHGMMYLVGTHCTDGSGKLCDHQIHYIQIPVFRDTDSKIFASPHVNVGFEDYTFGGGNDNKALSLAGPSFEIPAIEVSTNNQVVIVYGRAGYGYNVFMDAPGAFYTILNNKGQFNATLHKAICPSGNKLACALPGHDASNIDVSGIAVDPSDDATIWMAHAFADGNKRKYRMVIGKVKP